MKIRCKSPAGATLYALIRRDTDGAVWDNVASAWDTWLDGDIGDYDVPLTDHGGDYYTATFPTAITLDATVYDIMVYKQAGGSPAITDIILTSYTLDRLELSAGQIIPFTVDTVTNTHTPTTTEFQADDLLEATTDHYKGRIVVFTSGALAGQATDITAYAAVGGIGQITCTALTEAPSNNDTGIIV